MFNNINATYTIGLMPLKANNTRFHVIKVTYILNAIKSSYTRSFMQSKTIPTILRLMQA